MKSELQEPSSPGVSSSNSPPGSGRRQRKSFRRDGKRREKKRRKPPQTEKEWGLNLWKKVTLISKMMIKCAVMHAFEGSWLPVST